MPVYEYYCDDCGCRFEEYREVKDRATCQCPSCKADARKVFRPVGVIFKGPGFHVNDYRKPEDKAKADSDKAGAASESKPKKD